jgi:3-hydroxyacyl-[acyl-carrier-protein] dehydratase
VEKEFVLQLDFEEIKKLIPQRFPFIMIDRIIELEPGKRAVSVKNVSGNDIFFLGHFPDRAVFPGAAIIEAMAQTAIVLFAASPPNPSLTEGGEAGGRKPLYYFGSVKARFLHTVVPGDQIKITVVNVKSLPSGSYVSAEAFVEDKKISEAELVFSVK